MEEDIRQGSHCAPNVGLGQGRPVAHAGVRPLAVAVPVVRQRRGAQRPQREPRCRGEAFSNARDRLATTSSGSAPGSASSPRSRRTTAPFRTALRMAGSPAPLATTVRVSATPPTERSICAGSISQLCRDPDTPNSRARRYVDDALPPGWPIFGCPHAQPPRPPGERAAKTGPLRWAASPFRGGPAPARRRRRPAAAPGCPSPAGTGGRRRGRGSRRRRPPGRHRPRRGR